MTDSNPTLAAARDALASAKEAAPRVNPRVLRRFEQKIRMTENALAAGNAPRARAGTGDGLRAVLERAEAKSAGRAPSVEQTRALDALRVQITRIEEAGDADGEKLASLLESLAADTVRMREVAAPKKKAASKKKAAPEKAIPEKTEVKADAKKKEARKTDAKNVVKTVSSKKTNSKKTK